LVEQKSLQCSGNFAYLTTGSHSLALEEHSVFAIGYIIEDNYMPIFLYIC